MLHSSSVSQQQHVQQSVMHSASKSVSAADAAVTSLVSFVSMMPLLSCIAHQYRGQCDARLPFTARPPTAVVQTFRPFGLPHLQQRLARAHRPIPSGGNPTFQAALHARRHMHRRCDQNAHARPIRAHRYRTEFHGCCRHGPRMSSSFLLRRAVGYRHTAARD